jgi:hypothetical protein
MYVSLFLGKLSVAHKHSFDLAVFGDLSYRSLPLSTIKVALVSRIYIIINYERNKNFTNNLYEYLSNWNYPKVYANIFGIRKKS